ncbi:hypothetical protein TNCV_4370301 [Trichonephila clavipes]|uniref:Uncharacterized protein n=1 Tax=Trichonephila clavipes TaxID=2585209 RepID=A0A8X6S292_TRICX|nr:hypothetical protein TNCV_4370301 [Trichonephila clavipes]
MSTVECDATFHTSYHTLHNIIQQLLRQFIPFLCECTDEGVLVCRRIVSTSNLPPQSISHIFKWGLNLENALAIRDVEYPRCLDNPEQRVFNDMLRCRP